MLVLMEENFSGIFAERVVINGRDGAPKREAAGQQYRNEYQSDIAL